MEKRVSYLPLAALLLAILAGAALFMKMSKPARSTEQIMGDARSALHRRQPAEAHRLAAQILEKTPQALLVAGQAAVDLEKYDEALQFYDRLAGQDVPEAVEGCLSAGEILLKKLRRFAEA